MVEVLAIFACLGWLVALFCGWLSSLPFFPALVTGAIGLPVLAIYDYFNLGRRWRLRGWRTRRVPVPPERFYWAMQHVRLRGTIFWTGLGTLVAWWNVVSMPAEASWEPSSLLGWANALAGTWTGARLLSTVLLFVRASQWFDAMSPNVVGLLRRTMYRLSDNYEYLGDQRRDPEKEKVY